jgi:hypothetical protein
MNDSIKIVLLVSGMLQRQLRYTFICCGRHVRPQLFMVATLEICASGDCFPATRASLKIH